MNYVSTNNILVLEGDESGEMMLFCNSTYTTSDVVSMCVVPVKVKYGSSPVVETCAMLDSCSEGTFIEKGLLKELRISGRNMNITVKTLNGERSEESVVIDGLEVANGTKLTVMESDMVINDMVSKGYAREAFSQPVVVGGSWYILHHGVYHLAKPEKNGVIFDCSVRYGQASFNQELMSGPDLTNQIVGILLRFGEGRVAFMVDIEAMFY